jgi:hypothetical protein
MSERVPLSMLYSGVRERVTALVREHCTDDDSADRVPVPATPGWSLHDVVAHLTGVAQDAVNGAVPRSGPTPEWTAGQVERGRDVPVLELLAAWEHASPAVESALDARPIWPMVIDAGSHEHDLRATLGDSSERDNPLVVIVAKLLLRGLDVPLPLQVTTEHHDVRVGPRTDAEQLVQLRTTTFEVFRWRMGRRSRAQLAAMNWGGADPAPFLDHLCIFGPADSDVIE